MATGGVVATGGSAATGGMVGTGGMAATGGAVGTGGMAQTGGSVGSGGISGTGGMMVGPPMGNCLSNPNATCDCNDYCAALAAKPCPFAGSFFPDGADCVATCTGFGWKPATLVQPVPGTNTAACRIQRAKSGGTACADASPTGGMLCPGVDDRCGTYCDAMTRNCPSSFGSRDACVSYCGQQSSTNPSWWAPSEKLTISGDSGNCRLYWASQAGLPGNTAACASAGPTSIMCQ